MSHEPGRRRCTDFLRPAGVRGLDDARHRPGHALRSPPLPRRRLAEHPCRLVPHRAGSPHACLRRLCGRGRAELGRTRPCRRRAQARARARTHRGLDLLDPDPDTDRRDALRPGRRGRGPDLGLRARCPAGARRPARAEAALGGLALASRAPDVGDRHRRRLGDGVRAPDLVLVEARRRVQAAGRRRLRDPQDPKLFFTGVVSWQALSWVFRAATVSTFSAPSTCPPRRTRRRSCSRCRACRRYCRSRRRRRHAAGADSYVFRDQPVAKTLLVSFSIGIQIRSRPSTSC